MQGKYLYGVIDSSSEAQLGIAGLGGASPLYTLACRGVGCVLSDYCGAEFGSMSKEEVIRSLLAHQRVVEHVMRQHTVLPVKFGTMLATSGEVRDLLSQGHRRFVDALAWIQDRVEVEVAATWDLGQVLREVSLEPEVVRAREAFASRPGGPTLEERVHLGQMVKVLLDRRRESYREQMTEFLKPAAVDLQPNALVSDQLVMNVAFLVERSNQEGFDSRVKQLNDLFHNQIRFRILGPLPPYSFATVEVARRSPEKMEEARRLLQLGEAFSEPEVRKAYRHRAAETHPDRRPGDDAAKSQFPKLRQASDLLVAYCRSQSESGGSWLIDIKRLRDDSVPHLPFAEMASVAGAAHV